MLEGRVITKVERRKGRGKGISRRGDSGNNGNKEERDGTLQTNTKQREMKERK